MRRSRMRRTGRRPVPGRSDAAQAFRDEVLRDPCAACGSEGPRDAHHAIPAQCLRRIARSMGLTDVEALAVIYNPAVGVALCSAWSENRCHERHTSAIERVPRHLLPERVFVAADELGPEAVAALEHEHPASDGYWGQAA